MPAHQDDYFLVRESKSNKKMTSKQLWVMMSERGVNVSARTVSGGLTLDRGLGISHTVGPLIAN